MCLPNSYDHTSSKTFCFYTEQERMTLNKKLFYAEQVKVSL